MANASHETLTVGTIYNVDTLTCVGWTEGDGSGHDGYHYADYFDADGRYLGPDEHGIEPRFDPVTTLAAEIADCIACARREAGYTGTDAAYELTPLDCESITDALGYKPTRDEWTAAGYHVGNAHVAEAE